MEGIARDSESDIAANFTGKEESYPPSSSLESCFINRKRVGCPSANKMEAINEFSCHICTNPFSFARPAVLFGCCNYEQCGQCVLKSFQCYRDHRNDSFTCPYCRTVANLRRFLWWDGENFVMFRDWRHRSSPISIRKLFRVLRGVAKMIVSVWSWDSEGNPEGTSKGDAIPIMEIRFWPLITQDKALLSDQALLIAKKGYKEHIEKYLAPFKASSDEGRCSFQHRFLVNLFMPATHEHAQTLRMHHSGLTN
jgi:hypothetical protein